MTNSNKQIWQQYYENAISQPRHPRTEFASSLVQSEINRAIDCGCGTGADIAYLNGIGYHTVGFDVNDDAIEICSKRFAGNDNVEVLECGFDNFNYPEVSLLIANHSLYFANPNTWEVTWQRMNNAVVSGGVFAGDFMGVNDSWANNYRSSTLPLEKDVLEAMFTDFDVVRLVERDEEGMTAIGKAKHWHTYSVVAVKR